MKKSVLIIGLVLIMAGIANAQVQRTYSKIVAKGSTSTPFGNYVIKVCDEPVILAGENVTSYLITYENSPVSLEILVDKEKNCKNYIVISEGLSIMYSCNGEYFGVKKIDEKYSEEGIVTDETNLDRINYFHQKVIAQGRMDEIPATTMIACYYPLLKAQK